MFRTTTARSPRAAIVIAALVATVLVPTAPAAAAPVAAAPVTAVTSPRGLQPADTAVDAGQPTLTTVLPTGSSGWRYYRATTAPTSKWRTARVAWRAGRAPLGFGASTGGISTKLPNSMRTKPLATYFQRGFELAEVPTGGLRVTTWADDGVVIFVNGVEVLRGNVDAGAPRHDRWWASTAPTSSKARARLITGEVPVEVLKAGANLISVQVQSNYRGTRNVTFDAKIVAVQLPEPTPPVDPEPTPPVDPEPTPPVDPEPTPPVETPAPTPTPTPVPTTPAGPVILPSPSNAERWGAPSWRDEFTYVDPASGEPAIDPTKWNVRDSSQMGLFVDAAKVDDGQVSVDDDGVAHLRADWLDTPLARPHASWPDWITHKTGYIDQRTIARGDVSRTQRWGRWEMRAQVPVGPKTYGALAAFWLRNGKSGEIDIMEAWGYNEVAAPGGQRIGSSTTTVHNDTMQTDPDRLIRHHVDGGGPRDVHRDFHVWAFELMPTYAAVYVDEQRVLYVTPETYPDLWNEAYFGSPFHMRINLHVGPSAKYWGLPDPNHRDWTQNLDYRIDYVRTWSYTPPPPAGAF